MGARPAADGLVAWRPEPDHGGGTGRLLRTIRDAAGTVVVWAATSSATWLPAWCRPSEPATTPPAGSGSAPGGWASTRWPSAWRQHRPFFTVDADCVASTPQTDWHLNRQFLDLIARSGTALFVSVDPATRTDAVDADLASALRLALDGGVPGGVEPMDWLDTTSPQRWRSGEVVDYRWFEASGADPYARNDEGEFTD